MDQKKFNERFDHLMEENIAINWIIRLKENGSFIGLIGIDKYHDSDDYEVSYQLLPKFWDQGLAFETVNAIINYATHKMNLSFLVSETQSANLSSTKLLEKLGMKPVKTLARFGEQQTLYAMNLGDTKIEP